MKTLTLTDETGKVIFQKTVHNWRVSEAGDQVHISVVPDPVKFVKVDSDTNPPWTILGPSHPYPTPHKTDLPAWARVSYPPPADERACLKQSFLTDSPNPCGEVPLNEPKYAPAPKPDYLGAAKNLQKELEANATREAWAGYAEGLKKMAEEQKAAVAKLAPELCAKSGSFPKGDCTILWGPKSGLKSPLFSPGSLEQAGYRLGYRLDPIEAKCRCDIKDLMSTGHAPKCPEAKKR